MGIKHLFTSPKSDGGDATLVRPSNWNADHELRWTQDKLLKGAGAGSDPTEIDVPTGAYTEGARVHHSANQSIAHATETTSAFDTEAYDTDTIHDNVTNNSRLTCKTAGKYLIGAQITFQVHADGFRVARFLLNGSTDIARVYVEPVTETYVGFNMVTVYDLSVNDYIELVVKQTSGGDLWLEGGSVYTHFWIQRIG